MTDQSRIRAGIETALPDRADFLNRMVGTLSETIEDFIGLEDAEHFIGIVGRRIGNSELADFPMGEKVDAAGLARHLTAFKARIGGGFAIESIDGDTITLVNTRCPFGKEAVGRPSLCQMTVNVFGRVAANATGFARVSVPEALSRGDQRCRVTVKLTHAKDADDDGQDFFG